MKRLCAAMQRALAFFLSKGNAVAGCTGIQLELDAETLRQMGLSAGRDVLLHDPVDAEVVAEFCRQRETRDPIGDWRGELAGTTGPRAGITCERHLHRISWPLPAPQLSHHLQPVAEHLQQIGNAPSAQPVPELCDHLVPIRDAIVAQGNRILRTDYHTGWWDLGLYFAHWVSVPALRRAMPVTLPVVQADDDDYHGPFGSLLCQEHRHALIWPLTPRNGGRCGADR